MLNIVIKKIKYKCIRLDSRMIKFYCKIIDYKHQIHFKALI
jgi:hypothetical protein